MADSTNTAARVPAATPSSPPIRTADMTSTEQQSPRGRGRGRGRGMRGQRGGGSDRGGSRGRGRGGQNHQPQPHQSDTAPDSSYGRPPGGSFGARLTEAASNPPGDAKAPATGTQGDNENAVAEDAEVCFICASPIDHTSIAPCNHQTCHICALRLRALYKTRACAHCRTEAPYVIFTDNPERQYQDFKDTEFVNVDENLGIKYEKEEIREDTVLLLRYNCPDKDCDQACYGWPDLHRHVRSKHGKTMCDLCTRNKKVFTHEHELFTFGELRRHEKFGDDNPGAVDQSGFKGHPECGFCKKRFYGDDELYTHCREAHERCHICDRRNGGRNPQYYLNYQELEKHFAEAHFVCMDPECQANKTNVFESEMDLKAHQLSEHPNGMSKDVRRDARLVDLSGFDVRTPYQPERSRRGGHGRGRDPNAEPLPMSSAQPMSRAELAYQRTMAIQSSSSLTPRNFGGQLTSTTSPRPSNAQPARFAGASAQAPVPQTEPDLSHLTFNPNDSQSTARTARHTAVTTRASNLLGNNQTKLSTFRTTISSYRSSTISAPALIDSFFSLFDCPSSELGILIRELADLYEDETKRSALLIAWNDWRSINEDYPSLPMAEGEGLPSSSSSMGVNVGSGRRVLKLKSSTQQSAQSRTARQGSWGNMLSAHSNTTAQRGPTGVGSEAFPSLPPSTAPRKPPSSNIAWNSLPTSSSSHNNTSHSTPSSTSYGTSRPIKQTVPQNTAALFPSLPSGQKPNLTIAGFNTRATGVRSGSNTPVSAWGSGGITPTPAQAQAALVAAASDSEVVGHSRGDTGMKGKGKAKKKGKGETLFHFG